MFKGVSKKQLAGAILAGVISITGITSVSAAGPGSDWSKFGKDRPVRMDFQERASAIETALKKLVTTGAITQAQSDAVLKIYTPAERKGPFEGLITAGTLTQAQADKIMNAMKTGRGVKKTMTDILKELVSVGTITQAQSDAVSKTFSDPIRAGMKNAIRKSPFEELVAAGTLTQETADKIITAIQEGRTSKKSVVSVLKELVTEGTITQAQSDALVEVFVAPVRGELDKAGRKSPLEKLVTAGTITQAQADVITNALKSALEETKK